MDAEASWRRAGFRYGAVFFVTVVLVVFEVLAPDAAWARATAVAIEGVAFTIVMATSRGRLEVRRTRASVVGVPVAVLVVLIAAGIVPRGLAFLIAGLLAFAIPGALVGGLVRLVRQQGITARAIAGALTIYLYVGLLFAWMIGFISAVESRPYFVQGDPGPGGRVYFSFATLTTTGYGDYTAATSVGRALAVVEMLMGQLYLVTVIGVLVGGLAGRRRQG